MNHYQTGVGANFGSLATSIQNAAHAVSASIAKSNSDPEPPKAAPAPTWVWALGGVTVLSAAAMILVPRFRR
jgi:hypothetical protein